jgi:hypothetical protein
VTRLRKLIVHPKYSDRSVIIEVDRLPPVPLVGSASLVQRYPRSRLDVEKFGAATAGEHRLAPTTHSSAAFVSQTAETQARADRIFWVWLRLVWTDWKSALMIVKAETVIAWHRKGFRLFWTWKIHRTKPGRPKVP